MCTCSCMKLSSMESLRWVRKWPVASQIQLWMRGCLSLYVLVSAPWLLFSLPQCASCSFVTNWTDPPVETCSSMAISHLQVGRSTLDLTSLQGQARCVLSLISWSSLLLDQCTRRSGGTVIVWRGLSIWVGVPCPWRELQWDAATLCHPT